MREFVRGLVIGWILVLAFGCSRAVPPPPPLSAEEEKALEESLKQASSAEGGQANTIPADQ